VFLILIVARHDHQGARHHRRRLRLAVGPAALCFNLASMTLGYGLPRLLRLDKRQSIAIGMEIGIHNGTLAIAIASTPTLLNNSTMAIPPAIYSLIMFFTAGLFGWLVSRGRPQTARPFPSRLPAEDRLNTSARARQSERQIDSYPAAFLDVAHFQYLHGRMTVPFTTLKVPGITVHHDVLWFHDHEQPEFAGFRDVAVLELLGRRLEFTRATAEVRFFGPGSVMQFGFTFPNLGDLVLFQTHTPTVAGDPMMHRVRFRWFADRKVPRPLVAYVVGSWMSQLEADIHIWGRKHYQGKPMLMPEERQLLEMRRWYRQFYPASGAP
jgi:hypothetical protein